ncbi:MAG: GntR family transcriptional regulator [Peptococcaceae bacterium]|nr:GntR family transcriptional regulator [Peptococcaceae bacterium]
MIVKKSLSEQIYESLRQDIINQKIKFGEKLVNQNLRERYGVSSTPVRDAINRLHQDGLLEDISNVGARVITFDYKMAAEINEIVWMLSTQAVKLSAKKGHAREVIPALAKCLELQQRHIDSPAYLDDDAQFHLTFFDFCDNPRYRELYLQHHTLWSILVKYYYCDKESTREHAISQHRMILEAYAAGDIPLAQNHLENHYQEALRPLRKVLGE